VPYDTDSEYKFILRSSNQDTQELTKYPKGWETSVLTLERSGQYDGIFHQFSIDLSFYSNGAGKEFLDFEYELNGVDAVAFINIQYKCSDGSFSELFDGKFNFGSYTREPDPVSEKVTKIEIESNDFSQIILNRGDVSVDLKSTTTLDGSSMTAKTYNNYDIDLPQQPIVFFSKLEEPTSVNYQNAFTMPGTTINQIFIQDPFPLFQNSIVTTTDNPDVNERLQSAIQDFTNTVNVAPWHSGDSTLITYPATYTVSYRFKGTLRDKETTGEQRQCGSCSMLMYYGATKATASFIVIGQYDSNGYVTSSTNYLVSTFDFNGSQTISVNSGDDLWLFSFWQNYATSNAGSFTMTYEFDFEIAEITISSNDDVDDTIGQGSAIFEAYSQITESITDQTDVAFDSNFYGRKNSQPTSYSDNGDGSFLAVTNGFGIRGFTPKSIPTSLNELFNATKAIHNLGLGVEKFGVNYRVIVEKLEHFYDKTEVVFVANNIRDLSMSIDTTIIYNQAEFGYSEWQTEETSGLDEFNSTREYELDVSNAKNVLTQVSDYIAAGFLIEKTRRKPYAGFASEDTEFDENMFFLTLNRSVDGGGIPDELDTIEFDEEVSASTNVLNPDLRYNFWLSPTRSMLRWMNVLGSSMVRVAGGLVNFRSGTGNIEATVTYDSIPSDGDYTGANLAENASIAWDDANVRQDEPLFIGENYTFNYPVSYSDYIEIRDNPHKLIEFKDGGSRKWGWIRSFEYSIQTKQGKFDLIRAYIPNA